MNEQMVHHYPPELFELLVDAIPRLLKGKQNVLDFFKGCGVDAVLYADVQKTVRQNRDQVNKYEIVRTILTRLNDQGDRTLAQRREVLKRVTQWEDFSSCYSNQRFEAEGLVANIQKVVNVKDAFTRMNQERKNAQEEHREKRDAAIDKQQRLKAERDQIKTDLSALFMETNASKRGTALEGVLNRLFKSHQILVREAFRRVGNAGEGVVEQIDGVVVVDSHVYLVEMKWRKDPLGTGDVSQHLVRVFNRNAARGILISQSGYTDPAITICRESLAQSVFILAKLEEIVFLVERGESLQDFLRFKINAAILDKDPLVEPLASKG